MVAFFSATVLDHATARGHQSRIRLRVTQLHADVGLLARVRPHRDTLVTAPDAKRTHPIEVIRTIAGQSPRPLSRDELRAFVARVIAGATEDNLARRVNPVATMSHGATGEFSFVRDVRVLRIEAFYAPHFMDAAPEERAWFENEFDIDFAVKEREDDPYVDDCDDYVNYRFRVELEARVEATYAAHLVTGARFEPPAFV